MSTVPLGHCRQSFNFVRGPVNVQTVPSSFGAVDVAKAPGRPEGPYGQVGGCALLVRVPSTANNSAPADPAFT